VNGIIRIRHIHIVRNYIEENVAVSVPYLNYPGRSVGRGHKTEPFLLDKQMIIWIIIIIYYVSRYVISRHHFTTKAEIYVIISFFYHLSSCFDFLFHF